jgi:hypothetical protein
LPLALEDLNFSQLAFELRFAHSYLLWDRAGQIWQEVLRIFPTVTVANAAPNNILFRDGPVDLHVEPNRATFQIFSRDALKNIPAVAEFLRMATSVLEIQTFNRMGLRMIYSKVFPTKEDAASELMKVGFLRIPEGRHFGVDGLILNPEIAFRKEEGSKGFSIRMKAEGVEFKVEIPYLWQHIAKPVQEVVETLTVDIDSYIQGTIIRSQIGFEEWITQAMHVIRRDTNEFLGG